MLGKCLSPCLNFACSPHSFREVNQVKELDLTLSRLPYNAYIYTIEHAINLSYFYHVIPSSIRILYAT